MITATLFVYGQGDQVNWGEHHFLQLPAPGDSVCVKDNVANLHYAIVRHTEYTVPSAHPAEEQPSAIVITDWKSVFSQADGA